MTAFSNAHPVEWTIPYARTPSLVLSAVFVLLLVPLSPQLAVVCHIHVLRFFQKSSRFHARGRCLLLTNLDPMMTFEVVFIMRRFAFCKRKASLRRRGRERQVGVFFFGFGVPVFPTLPVCIFHHN